MTASRRMIVRTVSRIVRAISFGVFWRAAPSTRAIIRSMNVSPGLVVIRTVMPSERTVVPPVTAQRSPPASRMTGADSPVIGDSSTVAMPSTTSPSPGITSPGPTSTRSPISQLGSGGHVALAARQETSGPRVASGGAQGGGLRPARPSATASAIVAKSTVAQSQTVTSHANPVGLTIAVTVVTAELTQTTKTTGCLMV